MTLASPEIHPPTRFEAWLERKNISWVTVTLLAFAIIFFIELPYSLKQGEGGVIRTSFYAAVIIAYALTCLAIIRHFLKKVFQTLHPLVRDFSAEQNGNPSLEWQIALIVGIVMVSMFIATAPDFSDFQGEIELVLVAAGSFTANLIFGWCLYALLAGVTQVANVVSGVAVTDLFDTTPFQPVANWCLAIAVSIMGAVTIATIFLREDMLMEFNMVTYGLALIVGVFAFFAGMWSTHQLMLKNKRAEIKKIDHQLSLLHNEILSLMQARDFDAANPLLESSAKLSAHRKLVKDIPVWPYTMGNLGSLFTSVAIPVTINILLRLVN